MSEFVLTLVQMDCLFGDPAGNFERAEAFVADAAGRGSDLVVLPELWSIALRPGKRRKPTRRPWPPSAGDDGWFGRFADLARDNHVWLTGSMLEGQGEPVLQYYGRSTAPRACWPPPTGRSTFFD